ncbi:MAG TPA: hypothetical protein VKH40_09065, partial [Alloacidobacterium sp.]|nr:hypothetical protein [Alloacidobacterium sp.]
AEQVEEQLNAMPSDMTAYVEVTAQQRDGILPVLKKSDTRAKIRTGGVAADLIPSSQEIAEFLVACANAKVPFKATAGLHHPLRSMQNLTYDESSATAMMHGFVNVFVAATVAYQGASVDEMIDVLNEQSSTAFQWEKNMLKWRNYLLSTKQIKAARQNFAISFGSCSFTEPVDDLKTLGWL